MVGPLPSEALRWRCDLESMPFETTADLEPNVGVVGQSSAAEALSFGLETDAPGQNIFIRGLTGTGRITLVQRLLDQLQPECRAKTDRCYVHNFTEPARPRLISLPPGQARKFRRMVQEIAEFIRDDLGDVLRSDAVKARRASLDRGQQEQVTAITEPFERDLKEANLALVSLQLDPVAQTAIFPLVEGKPVPPEEYEQLRTQGNITDLQYDLYVERRESFQKRLEEVTEQIRSIRRKHDQAVHSIIEETARAVLGDMARAILAEFNGEDVQKFLSQLIDDVAEHRLRGGDDLPRVDLYGVNIVAEHDSDEACPIIVENTPTLSNLLGTIDREWTPQGAARSDFRMIRPGSILHADGGYLILDAREVLSEPGAWRVLLRTLKCGELEMVPAEFGSFFAPTLKPEPIPVRLKVILLGDSSIYYMLDDHDPDFEQLFKVLADFDPGIAREPEGTTQYAGVLARIARDEGLPPFHKTAVAALVEHGARVASRRGKLTSRFARIADIAREAAYLSGKQGLDLVTGVQVQQAIDRTRRRADLPSRRFRELLADGTIQIQTQGAVVGQINGLAVIRSGPIIYGFPARITASIGAGSAGIINIEGQAQLSGAIHTKGFHILGGLLRNLLQADHPLAFSASVAFEQTYGGIDGDSASGAEICCLLSALTGIPIQQELAITGAIDQMGHLQAIGGVNEKIEGFFDFCRELGLTGNQGVIIPKTNAGDLMLRYDVVEACSRGEFSIFAVGTVHEALEVLTGVPASQRDEDGEYPDGTVLAKAVAQARQYWLKSIYKPEIDLSSHGQEEEEALRDEMKK